MFALKRFDDPRFDRLSAIIDGLDGHMTSYVNLIGSATLPLPEVCHMGAVPATACRVEGHLDSRFFPATGPMDQAESLIEEKTRVLFGFDEGYGVSAQLHSATQANHAVFHAILGEQGAPKPVRRLKAVVRALSGREAEAATVAGLKPADGGHISHRFGIPSPHRFVPLPIDAAGIDYETASEIVSSVRPAIIVAGGSSYTRGVDYARLREIADLVDAHLHADLAHVAPFIATGIHPAAFPYVDSATIDTSKNLRGPSGGILVYPQRDAKRIRRAIFPVLQSSPNKNGLMTKAACMACWSLEDLTDYATRMVRIARIMSDRLALTLGEPVFGGTDSHLLLFDATGRCDDGRQAEELLERSRILVNRNLLPGDTRPPATPSGIRLSSTVPTILGYTDEDAVALGDAICSILDQRTDHEPTIARLLETYHYPIVNTSNEPT